MPSVETESDTIPSPLRESGEFARAQIEVSPGAIDHAPRYVERVLGELRSVVAGIRCPAHDCGPSLTVDFGCEDTETVDVIAHDCCPALDDLVSKALAGSLLFRLLLPR